jgi:hypothetical protein
VRQPHHPRRPAAEPDQLGNGYRRRFDSHWDFVRYAQKQHLDLDFTTPPKRPERKLPPRFVE